MKTRCALIALLLCSSVNMLAQNVPAVIKSYRAAADFVLTADPNAAAWKGIDGVFSERGPRGELTPGHRTEIRARWTDKNLYLLFICPYEELFLKPDPVTKSETNRLWDWDVAEAFIGSDFANITRYKEFQVSPQGEWVDLDIDRGSTPVNHDMSWNSGYEVTPRVVKATKVWYGAMRIPFDQLDTRPPQAGNDLRVNFYRFQGPPPDRKRIAWQPTSSDSYHVPESFGLMRLVR